MTVKISPSPRLQFTDTSGNPLVGAKLFTYAAGSATKQTTYTDSAGLTANTNPIILDSSGRTPYGLWLTDSVAYKYVLAPATDTDPPTSPIITEDDILGSGNTSSSVSQWLASNATPTYVSAYVFTLTGDKTTDFHAGRRLKLSTTAGTIYATIAESAYTSLTTVTVTTDSGVLDSGLTSWNLA